MFVQYRIDLISDVCTIPFKDNSNSMGFIFFELFIHSILSVYQDHVLVGLFVGLLNIWNF